MFPNQIMGNAQYDLSLTLFREDALEMAQKINFDIIFLDIEMPIKDGIQTCKDLLQFYSDANRNKIPIVHKLPFLNEQRITTNPYLKHVDKSLPILVGLSSHSPDFISKKCWKAGFHYYSNLIIFCSFS
jgi:CheY-like chemotaxis protein